MDYANIRLISKDTDLSKLKIDKYNWDVRLQGLPYQVVRIHGYVHTLGGKRGINDLWMYPRYEKMRYDNLIQFNCEGSGVCWGIRVEPKNYMKTKWDETEAFTSSGAMITRNGDDFYFCSGGIDEARYKIAVTIPEHPISFNMYQFEDEVNNRKIFYRSQPAIVAKWLGGDDARIVIVPDGDPFKVPAEFDNDEDREYYEDDEVITTVFDSNIWWFRE